MGSLDRRRKVKSILDYCNELLDKDLIQSFDIIGYGGNVDLPKIRINVIKDIPHEIVFEYLQRYDVGLAWVPSELYSSSPSLKIYEYMAAGLSVVAPPNQAFLEDKKKGYDFEICSFQSSKEIYEAVNRAYHKEKDSKNKNLDILSTQTWSKVFTKFFYPEIHRLSLLEKQNFRIPIGHVNFGVFDNHYFKPKSKALKLIVIQIAQI